VHAHKLFRINYIHFDSCTAFWRLNEFIDAVFQDSNALYMTDYEKFKENVFDSNK